MTVAQFIAHLKTLPQDAELIVVDEKETWKLGFIDGYEMGIVEELRDYAKGKGVPIQPELEQFSDKNDYVVISFSD